MIKVTVIYARDLPILLNAAAAVVFVNGYYIPIGYIYIYIYASRESDPDE